MKKLLVIVSLISFVQLGSQAQVKTCKQFEEFTTVQVYDNIIATLERGEKYELCSGADTKLEELLISIEGGVLRIRKVAGKKYEKQPKIRIIYTEINTIEGYAKADIDTRNLIKGDNLKVILKSGSRFYGDCDVKELEVNITEGSLLRLDGYAVNQKITSLSKATFSGFELEGDKAEVKASKGGTIKVNVEKELKGSASTGGHIIYKGTPRKDVKTNLGGKLVASE